MQHLDPATVPRGVWLGASVRLGHPVPVDGPYPHVCVPDAYPQAQRRDCAACAEAAQDPREDIRYAVGGV